MTRGSRQYWPHRRAVRRLPRLRPKPHFGEISKISNIVGFKAGMTSMTVIDDSESLSKQQEIERACTIVEIPDMELYGIRLYKKDKLTSYPIASTEIYNKSIAEKLKMKKIKNDESKINTIKDHISEYSDVSALIVAYPSTTAIEQKHVVRFESHIRGKSTKEKFEFLSSQLGKPITTEHVFKNGEYIDVVSISVGKGWAGVIKRYGVARLPHKSSQKIRHVGTLGDYGTGRVLYSVPQAGQMGFNYRTEKNKRILKLGSKSNVSEINKKGGFMNYGVLKNNYVVIDGSIPGPSKRLVRLRESNGRLNKRGIKEPKIISVNM